MSLEPASRLRYKFKTQPFAHQLKALGKIKKLDGKAALFMEMGTGKTKVAIDWAGIGFYNYDVRRVLVVAPLSVLGVWPKQIKQHSPVPARIFRLQGATETRLAALRKIIRHPDDTKLSWIIINYEGIWREGNRSSIEELIKQWDPDLVIFDESHRLKSPTSKQSRAAHRISKEARHRLILTGTPITKAPLDAFGQLRCVHEGIFGTNWYQFRNRYGIWGGFGRFQLRGYRYLDELIERVRTWSYRVRKDQCLDLPPKMYLDVPVTLSDKARKMYKQMAEEMIVEFEDSAATATIVLTRILRLSQITSGFLKDIEGKIRVIDDSKLVTCMDLVDDLLEEDHKVVIFARFITDIERIAGELTNRKVGYRILSGSVPALQRDSFIADFHNNPMIKVFIAQTQAGALGIELTAADAAIFFSMDYNAANYWQAQDRLHRQGQTRKVTYYHLVVPHSVDTVVLNVLKDKGKLAKAILHDPKMLLID